MKYQTEFRDQALARGLLAAIRAAAAALPPMAPARAAGTWLSHSAAPGSSPQARSTGASSAGA